MVVNSSPIIALGKAGRLELLRGLFGTVTITEQVYTEIMAKPEREEAIALKRAREAGTWITVERVKKLDSGLGAGEASSLSLAFKRKEVLIADDRKAAFVSSTLGIECHGTLYLVMLAFKLKVLRNKEEAITLVNTLLKGGFYLGSDSLARFYELLNEKIEKKL